MILEDYPFKLPQTRCSSTGSVSVRASKYRPCRVEADARSSGFQDAQHGHGPPEKEQPAAIGGNVLVRTGAEAEEVSEFVVTSAEPGGRSWALEAPHGPVAAFDAPVVLLQPVIQVAAGAVPHPFAELAPDRPRVAVVTVGRDPVRRHAGDCPGRAEERLRRRHVALLAEHHVD